MTVEKPRPEDLVLTVHSIANFKQRARIGSAVVATDEIRRLFGKAHLSGVQAEPRGRSRSKPLRAPHKSLEVTVWGVHDNDVHWVFYVRGRVLLTVHAHPMKKAASDEEGR